MRFLGLIAALGLLSPGVADAEPAPHAQGFLTASGSISIPGAVTHSEGILLVYHSDRAAHGMSRGQIGVDAHHQLIIRVP
ncbi:MAG: hypothetical protein M3169_07575 [Candidatus Eremiobacteraeota bacterium]|nr:hypothetical protein [Candidatus Eremiobacteraeota bacterium]